MAHAHHRHIYHILSKKIGLALLCLLFGGQAMGQSLNHPFYDFDRWIHFGFTVGTNFATLKYDRSASWYHQNTPDSVVKVSAAGSPGITFGAVADLHLGSSKSYFREHFDLRFIPSLTITERQFIFTMKDSSTITKTIESALVEFPLLVKFKSDRSGNIRFYVIGGADYSYDLSSTAKAAANPANPKISIYPSNYAYQFGAGLDLYFPFFKFSPEIKVSQGINNVLVPANTPFSSIFSRFRSNFVYFSLYFEG